jgi:hypothetical protein
VCRHQGLIAEGNEHIKETAKGPLLDAALIEGAQKIEHYEIAGYAPPEPMRLRQARTMSPRFWRRRFGRKRRRTSC